MSDYNYKVIDFSKLRDGGTEKIISASMTIHCEKDGKEAYRIGSLTSEEIESYEKDDSFAKTVAERISSLAKYAVDQQIKNGNQGPVEKDTQSDLDKIVIDPEKVK